MHLGVNCARMQRKTLSSLLNSENDLPSFWSDQNKVTIITGWLCKWCGNIVRLPLRISMKIMQNLPNQQSDSNFTTLSGFSLFTWNMASYLVRLNKVIVPVLLSFCCAVLFNTLGHLSPQKNSGLKELQLK